MNRARLAAFVGAALLAGCATSGHTKPAVNTAYKITGNAAAAPVQAFSVEGRLYLQLQNIHRVPAPFVNGQPVTYRIYGPYIILHPYAHITLRYAGKTATVTAASSPADSGKPEVAMTTPVSAMDPPPAPAAPPVSHFYPSAPTPVTNHLTGSITAGGNAIHHNAVTVDLADAPSALSMLPRPIAGILLVQADGTVRGAQAATKIVGQCAHRHIACHIQYHGAPAGSVTVEKMP